MKEIIKEKERAILAGLHTTRADEDIERSMEELALLAETAGAVVVDRVVQKRNAPDSAYYVGRGKIDELINLAEMSEAEMIIFNDELSPSQIRNIDQLTEVKVIDRTNLILDIFARRALSREGKLQVELAQMNYLLPRLIGLGNKLSRLGGGIGARGPGETQLEVDRRVIRRRITDLKKEIKSLRKHRSLHRKQREENRLNIISLVGYTNAGKSTLLNALTGAELYTEDKLFATLDPIVRRGTLNGGQEVLFTDTVGFIEKLPDQLVTAFQATLEELLSANLLLHVVDLSHPDYYNQIKVVREHLAGIDPEHYRRELLVFNKIDQVEDSSQYSFLAREFPSASFISAQTGEGLDRLKENITSYIKQQRWNLKIYLPYSEGKLYSELQKYGEVERVKSKPEYLEIIAAVDAKMAAKLEPYTQPPVQNYGSHTD
ncbi:MAG: GTPase HflX [Bacillota bacterium]